METPIFISTKWILGLTTLIIHAFPSTSDRPSIGTAGTGTIGTGTVHITAGIGTTAGAATHTTTLIIITTLTTPDTTLTTAVTLQA